MVRAVWFPLVGAVALASVTIVLLPTRTDAQLSVTIALSAQNGSSQSGTAVLTPDGVGTKVVLTLSNAPGPHPAHIHAGSCPTPGAVVFPLTSVVNGRSETTVAASIADILKAPHAINVHKSPTEIQVYTSCGNITDTSGLPSAVPSIVPTVIPAAQASPVAKPGAGAPSTAATVQPVPAASPAAAPAQAPRPVSSPSALPRTGEADPTAGLGMFVVGGIAFVVVGVALLVWRRRSL
ncbi:MAG: hypothetical protein U0893_18505 [Chloroflexota bacterium]